MAYASNTQNASQGGIAARVEALIVDVRARMARRKIFNDTFREMAQLSDRDLADLGLHRTEIRRVAWQAANEA